MARRSPVAVLIDARDAGAAERARAAAKAAGNLSPGSVLLGTCHRIEWYGTDAQPVPPGLDRGRRLEDDDAVRHLVRLAVGLESAVLAEDQLLHQLRAAVAQARRTGPLPGDLGHALDLALRAGRVARSWVPRGRSLATLALERIADAASTPRAVLVVGTGRMGRAAIDAARGMGASVRVASRTPGRAGVLAAATGARAVPFDPGQGGLVSIEVVVVALAGPWTITPGTVEQIAAMRPWIVDLSAPSATPEWLATQLGDRFLSIDDLALPNRHPDEPLRERLEQLATDTVASYARWRAEAPERAAARAASERAAWLRDRELATLWSRIPSLTPDERAEVARMAGRLADRLVGELARR